MSSSFHLITVSTNLVKIMNTKHTTIQNSTNIPWLDGLRGFAAFWVLISHVQILSGLHYVRFLSWGSLAVDLFMILSGFLMTFHYIERQSKEPWDKKNTVIKFWLRRFFRIAPLFYLLLIIAFLLGPQLGDYRNAIAQHWPDTATSNLRYTDTSLANFFAHISFAFGFIPDYSFRSPLPDWSIGLEMQFYIAFPLIMLLMLRLNPIVVTLLLVFVCLICKKLMPDFFHAFSMPSFLLIKLYVFMIGIWIAYSRWQGKMLVGLVISLAMTTLWFYFERGEQAFARFLLVTLMFYLMDNGSMPLSKHVRPLIDSLRKLLSAKFSVFLGEASYASYLVHLLFVIPICGVLTFYDFYIGMNGYSRFFTALIISIVPIYLTSWFLYQRIEKPGIKVGKKVVSFLFK